jgi:hypothetical protein
MREGIIRANLSAKILDITLNLKLTIAMGLYYSMESALDDFGIRITLLALKLGRIQPV